MTSIQKLEFKIQNSAAAEALPQWYCLRSQPKHEHIAAARLREVEGVEVFCPRVRLQRSTVQGLKWFTEALFPNYLFARFDLDSQRSLVTYSHSVSGIVHFGDKFPTIPHEAIEELRQVIGDGELVTVATAPVEGDEVEIVQGPLRGSSGVVTQILPARERVRVLLEFLGRTREVELRLTDVFRRPSPVVAADD